MNSNEIATRTHARVRAHDSIDDSIRYDNGEREESYATGAFDDGLMLPFTEEELKEKLGVDFIRTPRNDVVVLQNPQYQGKARIKNKKYHYNYEAHIWKVEFVAINDMEFELPKNGLLQIRSRNLKLAGFADSVKDLFSRKSRIVADEKGRILSISDY